MKRWLREQGMSYARLADQLGQSDSSISQKVNRKTPWQYADRVKLNQLHGLSSDFVPYESVFPSHDVLEVA